MELSASPGVVRLLNLAEDRLNFYATSELCRGGEAGDVLNPLKSKARRDTVTKFNHKDGESGSLPESQDQVTLPTVNQKQIS